MTQPDHLNVPYLDLSHHDMGALTLLDEDTKWNLVTRLLAEHGHQRDDVPEVWATHPLAAWCWLVLAINGIDHDPDDHRPLIHYGIDLGFSSEDVRRWIWTIS
jgi:hypothetical protein